jgi:hypothetical protein
MPAYRSKRNYREGAAPTILKNLRDQIVTATIVSILTAAGWCVTSYVKTIHRIDDNEAAFDSYMIGCTQYLLPRNLILSAYEELLKRSLNRNKRLTATLQAMAKDPSVSLLSSAQVLVNELAKEATDDESSFEAFNGHEFELGSDLRDRMTAWVRQDRAMWPRYSKFLASEQGKVWVADEHVCDEIKAASDEIIQLGGLVIASARANFPLMLEKLSEYSEAIESHKQKTASLKTERRLFGIASISLIGLAGVVGGCVFVTSRGRRLDQKEASKESPLSLL